MDAAVRCVATRDLVAGSLVLSDAPGEGKAEAVAAAAVLSVGARVQVVKGPLNGRSGKVVELRDGEGTTVVLVDGTGGKRVVLPAEKLAVMESFKKKREV